MTQEYARYKHESTKSIANTDESKVDQVLGEIPAIRVFESLISTK